MEREEVMSSSGPMMKIDGERNSIWTVRKKVMGGHEEKASRDGRG